MGRGAVEGDLPWRLAAPLAVPVPTHVLERPALDVARFLLGARVVSTIGGCRTVGVIVETEAYQGADDPASHAATRAGRTDRNRAMFGPAGRAYVYRSYGVHWCMNVVTGEEGSPEAVLIRGLDVLEGAETMRSRRSGRMPMAAGPGRLSQALGITGELYGHDLREDPLRLVQGWTVPDKLVGVSGRIGISEAADRQFRFYVLGSSGVTRHRYNGPRRRPRQ